MTIADHGEPAVAWLFVTTREGDGAARTTRVGVGRTATGEPCAHGGSARCSVGWIVQLSVASS
jgi:hypothetical protein